jgi:phosphate transport system substrate-binding protein
VTSQSIGDYRLLARLGRGSLTEAFLATGRGAPQRAELVVIKRLRRDVDVRMAREGAAQLATRLTHPNIARTCEIGRQADSAYHVQEYLEGQPLDRVLAVATRSHGLPRRLALQIVSDVLAGLECAHGLRAEDGSSLGIVHGAVRPHNVFVTYEGEIKLLDFGAAWLDSGAHLGADAQHEAALYLAPEQKAAAEAVDHRADVFAAGMLLRECLSCERAISAEALPAVYARLAERPLPNLTALEPELPSALVSCADRAVQLDPADRLLTAADLRGALASSAGDADENHAELKRLLGQLFEGELRQRALRVAELATSTESSAPNLSTTTARSTPAATRDAAGFDFDDFMDGPTRPAAAPKPAPARARVSEPPPPPPQRAPAPRVSKLPPALPQRATPRSQQPQAPVPASARREDADSLMRLSIPRAEPATGTRPTPAARKQLARVAALLIPIAVLGVALWATRAKAPVVSTLTEAGAIAAAEGGGVDPLERQRGAAARTQAHASAAALRLCGSNTVGAELAPALVEAFLADKGASDIARRRGSDAEAITISGSLAGKPLAIEIRAGGTATAFTGLAEGSCDIGMASRSIHAAEATGLRERGHGDLRTSATEHVIALDGIAVIVHPDNPLRSLDRATLHDIFTGKIADWSHLGGTAGPIKVLARDDKSGTYDTFKQLVLSGDPLTQSTQRFAGSEALSDAIAAEPAAIGFVGFAYVRAARALAVGEPGAAPMLPSLFTVGTESYMLSRRLYLYTLPKPRVPWVTELVSFALSRRAQDVVAKNQFIGLGVSLQTAACAQGCPEAYEKAVAGAERASLDFRFRTGSNEPDSRAGRDIERLVAYLAELRASKVVLLGFSDASGAPAINERLSLARAQAVEHELALRGVQAAQLRAFGAAMPVASNTTEDGRQRNRRVEVWVVR